MIVGMIDDRTSILIELSKSLYVFYLTGSRFFGGAREDSDYDFFVAMNYTVASPTPDSVIPRPVEQFLLDKGFVNQRGLTMSNYPDKCTSKVLVHQIHPIHIQLVYDSSLKFSAQELIKKMIPFFPIGLWNEKGSRQQIWNAAIDAVKSYTK